MILCVPNNMHSSQLTQICNKEVSIKSLQKPYDLQNKEIHAMNQPTRDWMLEKYA
jgi:hypothetical protein